MVVLISRFPIRSSSLVLNFGVVSGHNFATSKMRLYSCKCIIGITCLNLFNDYFCITL